MHDRDVSSRPSASNTTGPAGAGWRLSSNKKSIGSFKTFPGTSSGSDSIVGEVRGFQNRTESRGPQYPTHIVWTFRVERHDEHGDRLSAVPVEMRSKSFEGFINEGDRVEIPGRWREGQLVRPRRLRNLTTGALVRARGAANWKMFVKVVFFIALLALFAAFAKFILDSRRLRPTPTPRRLGSVLSVSPRADLPIGWLHRHNAP
jgi:hypothetical protein